MNEKGSAGFVVVASQPSPFENRTRPHRPSGSEGIVSREEIQRSLFGRIKRRIPKPESPVLKAVMDYLNLVRGCRVWRQNTGGAMYGTQFVRFGQKGMCDVSGICRGIRIEVETKAPGEEPEVWQEAWMEMIRNYGGISFWADSLEMCQTKLADEFQKRGWQL